MKHSFKKNPIAVGLAAALLAMIPVGVVAQAASCIISGSIEIAEPEASYQVAEYDVDTRTYAIDWTVVHSGMIILVW